MMAKAKKKSANCNVKIKPRWVKIKKSGRSMFHCLASISFTILATLDYHSPSSTFLFPPFPANPFSLSSFSSSQKPTALISFSLCKRRVQLLQPTSIHLPHYSSIPSESQKDPKVAEEEEEEEIMGRGKIEIKKIENRTNRQVTFSKRRNGIMKKAQELTVLCDAKVSLIMISCTEKLYQYLSPGADIKKMYDEYQKIMGVDLWATHYEKMQEHKQQLLEINSMLRREINQRMGGDLDDLHFGDLCSLEQEMDGALEAIRNQRVHKIKTQTGTTRKKVKNLEERHGNLLMELDARFRAPHFGLADDDQGGYDTDAGYANDGAAANIYALSHRTCHLNLHQGGAAYGDVHDLRLA